MGRQCVDGVALLPLAGELDIAVAEDIRRAGLDAVRAGARIVTFDLNDARFIDAGALGALVDVQREASAHGAALRVVNVAARVLRVFDIAGLTEPLGVTAAPA